MTIYRFVWKQINNNKNVSQNTHCVLSVNAADVIEEGSPSPLMTSCHSFLLMTSTRPPLAMTRLKSS
jgi:hypothetical protein